MRLKLPGAHKQGGVVFSRQRAFLSAAQPPCASGLSAIH